MSWLNELARMLQKPQSIMTGAMLGSMRGLGLPTTNYFGEASNPLSGAIAGAKNPIRPSNVVDFNPNDNNTNSLLQKLANTSLDIAVDPLTMAGPIARGTGLGAKLAEAGKLGALAGAAVEGAGTAGKYDESLSGGAKLTAAAARALRRTAQGTLATGDPITGAGFGQLLGLGENSLTKFLPRLSEAAIKSAPELADDLSGVPSSMQVAGNGNLSDVMGPPRGALGQGRFAEAQNRLTNVQTVPGTGGPFAGGAAPMQELAPPSQLALGAGSQPGNELGAASAISMGPGPRTFPMGPAPGQGAMPISAQDVINALYRKGSQGKNDQITQAIRAIINSQR
jgi:hypothetical protein